MSELLPPEMELHQRQDAVIDAALQMRRVQLKGNEALARSESVTGNDPIWRELLRLESEWLKSAALLAEATDALQAWHNENGR